MRYLLILFFVALNIFLPAQEVKPRVEAMLIADPLNSSIKLTLKSSSDSIHNCNVQVYGADNKLVRLIKLPVVSNNFQTVIDFYDLPPGYYTCAVFRVNEEINKINFKKDLFDSTPVISRPNEK